MKQETVLISTRNGKQVSNGKHGLHFIEFEALLNDVLKRSIDLGRSIIIYEPGESSKTMEEEIEYHEKFINHYLDTIQLQTLRADSGDVKIMNTYSNNIYFIMNLLIKYVNTNYTIQIKPFVSTTNVMIKSINLLKSIKKIMRIANFKNSKTNFKN